MFWLRPQLGGLGTGLTTFWLFWICKNMLVSFPDPLWVRGTCFTWHTVTWSWSNKERPCLCGQTLPPLRPPPSPSFTPSRDFHDGRHWSSCLDAKRKKNVDSAGSIVTPLHDDWVQVLQCLWRLLPRQWMMLSYIVPTMDMGLATFGRD